MITMPKKLRPLPSKEELLATFDYDPETGILRWKTARKKVRVGDIAGALQKTGYLAIGNAARRAYAHRIIWKMMTGEEPPEIDHRDWDKSNNRWVNLRAANRTGNTRNQRKLKAGTSKYRGVSWNRRRDAWRAKITVDRRDIHLGFFEDEDAAAQAYRKASEKYHGTFGNAGPVASTATA